MPQFVVLRPDGEEVDVTKRIGASKTAKDLEKVLKSALNNGENSIKGKSNEPDNGHT
jgi:uncharacterized protein (DUF2147 family)|tara:strand:+ start:123 stop:293 length:171 start_codon:yes stop_codon:yes gene_type:complete